MPKFEYDKDYPFAAFITNLGKYNEGELVGEWVKFPTTAEKMQEVFKRIGIGEKDDFGYVYEEWFITDYDCYVDGLYDKLGEYSNIDELNYLASKLDDMMQYDYDKFCAAVSMGDHTNSIQDLINLTENLDCYEVYSDIDDDDDLGRYYLEEVDVLQIPDYLRGYIDYEAYGRDVRISEGGEYTDFGYVRDSGSRFVEFYNGDREDIPEEYRVMNFETELTDEKRSEWAKDLAFDLDEFFRQQDPVYAAENPDEVAAKQALQDKLFDGKIAAIDQRLAALGQVESDYLPNRVANYKELIGYEDFLDIDTDALRQTIQNPDPSRVEAMLDFAVKAEQEYAAEAAAYVQTPADIIRQAQALQDQPDDHLTGEKVQTPRGSFSLTSLSKEQMEAAGYGVHHNSEDGRYHIMGNGTRAFAVVNAEVREREHHATAKELAVDIDRLCRDHIQGYIHTFPRADYQQEIIAARIMEGETYLFKTQLLNFKQPEATADTIRRLDNFEKDRGIGTYMVYQLKHTEENHLLRFEALDRLYAAGKTVDPSNYELVYAGPFTPGETLETIYRDLNVDHPEDYHGYSLSMSDVVVLREYGKDTAHYCDTIGFTEVPQFLNPQQVKEKENPLRTVEMTIEDDYGMIDGVINNGRRDEPQGKPSIRERLEAAKKECAGRKAPEAKHPEKGAPEQGSL